MWGGEGTCFEVQPRAHTRGGGSAPRSCGFRSIYAYTLCRSTTKLDVVTHACRRGACIRHASHPKTAEFQRSPILRVGLYLCLHPLTQNNQIRHGNKYGEGVFLGVSHAIAFAQMRRAVCQR